MNNVPSESIERNPFRGGNWLAVLSVVLLLALWTMLYMMTWIPSYYLLTAITGVMIITAMYAYPQILKENWRIGRLLWVSLLTAGFLYIVYQLVIRYLQEHFPYALQKWELVVYLREEYHLIPAILLFSAVAIGEELFWRGFIQSKIARKIGRDRAILASALLYAGVHIPANAPVLFFAAFFAGIYWGWIYARSQTIWVTLLAHTVWAIAIMFGQGITEHYVALLRTFLVV